MIELYPGAGDSPFASMMAELLRQNLADDPSKRAAFARMRGRVALVAEDIDAAVTLHFDRGRLRVHRGLHGIPDVALRGPCELLVDLSRLPKDRRLPFLPDLGAEVTRTVWTALRTRKLRLVGALEHPLLTLRLSRVLSVYARSTPKPVRPSPPNLCGAPQNRP